MARDGDNRLNYRAPHGRWPSTGFHGWYRKEVHNSAPTITLCEVHSEMTSQERHEARYQRRKAARQAKHRARIAQIILTGWQMYPRWSMPTITPAKALCGKPALPDTMPVISKIQSKSTKPSCAVATPAEGFIILGLWSAAKSGLSTVCTTLSALCGGLPAQMLWCRFCPAI